MEPNPAKPIFDTESQPGFDFVTITLAAPETVRSWSHGEVKNPETINYRTFKPEKGGLFCERIFGPTKDWECSCGKYKRIKHKNIVCDRCGVEVTLARVRRDRMGHIELAVPVSHLWFFKCAPSRMATVLDMTAKALERVLYYEDYIVVDPGDTALEPRQLLNEDEYREALDAYGDTFVAKMGAEGVREILARIDLVEELDQLETAMENTRSKQTRKKLTKRMKIIDSFRTSHTRPEWMILEVLPVIPPDLRPLVPLEGGRFATSDLNDLYRRVINRNNRLKNLLQLKTPDVIVRNEKRMLQEAVDALFDNGRHGRAVTGAGNRPLKSLSDMLKGKQGRFRQNLLGKRVDYSGRSVIVIGPGLRMNQCGLPKKMALVLFEPFIIRRLKAMGVVHTVRSAKKMIEREEDQVWDILEEVTQGHTVMLNRAPTLHRLSIQSFEPVLIEGEAIRIHPLVCTAYNADFDGDQMAVHVPLSIEAQMESKLVMLASNNIFSPSSGKPITTPTQDIALGCYYLTVDSQRERLRSRQAKVSDAIEHLPIFTDFQEVHTAYDSGALNLHSRIRFRNPDYQTETQYGVKDRSVITTTAGRVFFNEIWPDAMGFFNAAVPKKKLEELIRHCYEVAGHEETVKTLDAVKDLGFESATRAGFSVGIVDMIVPETKDKTIDIARKSLAEVESQYRKGIITDGERYNKIIDVWTHATDEVSGQMFRAMEYNESRSEVNPLFMMVDSGARGNRQQIRQLAGMRGLMAKPSGEIIERPILANFREGLSVLEYFISTHGARKGLADTALKTADSGYMTRKLVDVSQDVIVVEEDCGTLNGIEVFAIMQGDEELVPLTQRILGRTTVDDIRAPRTGEMIVAAGYEIDEKVAEKIRRAEIESVKIRSVLTCESRRGICAKCYGRNLATGHTAVLGEATGIIAAQSIGEPGTQLTMRTFHIGGTASSTFKQPEIVVKQDGVVKYEELYSVPGPDGNHIVLNKSGMLGLYDKEGRELERHAVPLGSVLPIQDGDKAKKGQAIAKWDPYNVPILGEYAGVVDTRDFMMGVTVRKETDEATGMEDLVILEHRDEIHPQIMIRDAADRKKILATYTMPAGAHVSVSKGDTITAGTVIAKTPRKQARTKDITGGLPRVSELFEARKPKDAADIAKIDGIVEMAGSTRGRRKLLVRDPITDDTEEHLIPLNKHIVVYAGDRVRKGQSLTEGPVVPQEILEVCGPQELQEYLVNEVQEVYRLQGVEINDKHIEIIVRQMLRKVRITEPGDTEFLWGEQVEKQTFLEVNRTVAEEGRKPAEAAPLLLGITKASLETESFIAAASFQDTTRVLTDAATLARRDNLRGFKENVIMGHVIPAGTGFSMYRNIKLVPLAEPISAEELLGDQLATVPGTSYFEA
ncbi:MAG: DNA-directed RNA polymerase subunit beta' [Kiritimatiellae bacterium]|nr:DNA-directed RNA polymerase subunit beta' [Kiritimatiellia bacterium]MDD4341195.1 DNA-directed RNA polymerase subunit beta' [Kiritimatiellia bacterium]